MSKSSHQAPSDPLTNLVRSFLESNLSIILIVFSLILGAAALVLTPREEDPQIVVPIADIYVNFPGHSAAEVEQLIATPLEQILYQIDGVEYAYSMSRENQAIITVRFYVGQDRERSLVKLFKKMDESQDQIPPGVLGWVVKPVEIDDVPIVTLALRQSDESHSRTDSHQLRRIGEELVQRISSVPEVSRAAVIGGEPRIVRVNVDSDRLRGHNLSLVNIDQAIKGSNVAQTAGSFTMSDQTFIVDVGAILNRADQLGELVVGVNQQQPVFLKDVAEIVDGPAEVAGYVRHHWGPARGFGLHANSPGTILGDLHSRDHDSAADKPESLHETEEPNQRSSDAVTLAISKQKGANAVHVAERVLEAADQFREQVLPDNVQLVVTRNYGLTAHEKVVTLQRSEVDFGGSGGSFPVSR